MADGDAIYLDSGTTTLRIAELLTARNVNALTNGIAVAAALAEKPTVRHTLVGGVLRPSAGAVAGALAVENVARFSVSTAFIGVTGLTADGAALMRKLRPVLKTHESRMIARLGEDGRDRLIALLHDIMDGQPHKGRLRNGKASRALRPGSAET